jgi:hypothetical protein
MRGGARGAADVAPPAPPCGHGRQELRPDGYRMRCGRCRSFWDREFAERPFRYDAAYPEARGHFDAATGQLKVRSLERWLAAAAIDPAGRVVCEVGFGGGHCLRYLADRSAQAFGIERVAENLEQARRLGVAGVVPFEERCRLPRAVDLWVFLDSFEHLCDPADFVAWLARRSSRDALLLVVAPEAGSLSERLLGRLWPHRIPDHAFHWSRRGLCEFLGGHGFKLWREFHPGKYVSCATVVSHLAHKFPRLGRLRAGAEAFARLTLFLNVGEMGLVFRRAT